MADDLARLAYVTRTVHAGARLETNYLVFTTKKSEKKLRSMVQEEEAALKRTHPRARGKVAFALKRYQPIPHWAKDHQKKINLHMAVAVFEISYKS